MTRPLRIEYPGTWYHVTSRGNERGEIFRDDKDRIRFLRALEESSERFKVEVHCYVLMSNHFHFLLRTREANLSRFMQRFNTAYTAYFNLRHHRAGHLYQGRFKAIVVEGNVRPEIMDQERFKFMLYETRKQLRASPLTSQWIPRTAAKPSSARPTSRGTGPRQSLAGSSRRSARHARQRTGHSASRSRSRCGRTANERWRLARTTKLLEPLAAGATFTSNAFIKSLQAALKPAGL